MNPTPEENEILEIERPHKDLMIYYVAISFAIPPLFPFVLVYHIIRYRTLRYRFTNEGISMSWGILFRREILIQYARIQDIHLRSNVVERWLGLSRILVQTASGSSGAEMTLEGLKEFEAVRDFLYHRMRGVKDQQATVARHSTESVGTENSDELAAILREITSEVRSLREGLSASGNKS